MGTATVLCRAQYSVAYYVLVWVTHVLLHPLNIHKTVSELHKLCHYPLRPPPHNAHMLNVRPGQLFITFQIATANAAAIKLCLHNVIETLRDRQLNYTQADNKCLISFRAPKKKKELHCSCSSTGLIDLFLVLRPVSFSPEAARAVCV